MGNSASKGGMSFNKKETDELKEAINGPYAEALSRIFLIKKLYPENRMAYDAHIVFFSQYAVSTLTLRISTLWAMRRRRGSCSVAAVALRIPTRAWGAMPCSPATTIASSPSSARLDHLFVGDICFSHCQVLADYHKVPADRKHINDWSLKGVAGLPESGVLDLGALGLPALSMRVRVGRNLADFPLPGAMTQVRLDMAGRGRQCDGAMVSHQKDDRVNMEKKMCEAFDKLVAMPEYGGGYNSLTPGHPNFVGLAMHRR